MYNNISFILYSRSSSHIFLRNAVSLPFKYVCDTRKYCSHFRKVHTAGIIVIGDEILKGQVVDNNTNFIAKGLYGVGVKLVKVSIVGDNVEDISNEVKHFSNKFTYVITTGGIGPTHDDLTYESVAHAFGESLFPHPELVKICQDFFKTSDLNAPALKLALIPKSGVLNYGYDNAKGIRTLYPIISVNNVFIFPGVSQLMKNSFSLLCDDLFGKAKHKFHAKEMFLAARETEIANDLNKVVAEYPSVTFGSYPNLFNSYYGVKLTVESLDENVLNEAFEKLKSCIPEGMQLNYDVNPLESAYEKISNLMLDSACHTFKESVKDALGVLEMCAEKFRPNEVALCFSGGKGSTVLLHLWYAILSHHNQSPKLPFHGVRIKEGNSKKEEDSFIEESMERYKLDLVTVECPVNAGLKNYLSTRPNIKAIILGARDPGNGAWDKALNVEMGERSVETICPLWKWSYGDVWYFIRSLHLPYCSLYDVGFTSVGSRDDTAQNPKLAANEVVYSLGARRGSTFYPAYTLKEWAAERLKQDEK